MQKIEQNHHITEETWIALSEDTIAPKAYMKILEHTCGCTWCAERLASVMEGEKHAQDPPVYLKDQITERASQLDIQLRMSVKRTENQISKQLRLFLYSLKVGLAVVVSVFLLVISANIQELGMTEQPSSWQATEEWDAREGAGEKNRQDAEGEASEDGLLVQMNRISQNATAWMNSFSNFILHGGK